MDRRQFIQSSVALGAASSLPFSINVAHAGALTPAANQTGYRALVCVFLFGGNDSHNMVVPYSTIDYNAYSVARGGLAGCLRNRDRHRAHQPQRRERRAAGLPAVRLHRGGPMPRPERLARARLERQAHEQRVLFASAGGAVEGALVTSDGG